MADNKEEKASFVEVIGAIAGMVASVVNPIIKNTPTPQEPPAIETPAEPSNQDFEDLIDKVADIAEVISDANKKKDDEQTAKDIDAMNAMIDRTPTNDIDRDNNPDGKSDDVKNENYNLMIEFVKDNTPENFIKDAKQLKKVLDK